MKRTNPFSGVNLTAFSNSHRAGFLFSGKGRVPRTEDTPEQLLDVLLTHKDAIAYVQAGSAPEGARIVYRFSP